MAERSKYQQKIIKNYYDNREAIALQRLGELVTELYLAEGKKRAKAVEEHRRRAGKAESARRRASSTWSSHDNPALVAKLVEELLAKK